jgi:zinc transport system ATP-binding protein
MAENIIEIKNLSFSFGNYQALDDISFNVKKGEIVAIIGPNGSGKTTLLNIIIGNYKPQIGSVLIKKQLPKKVRQKIGYVPQKFQFDREIPITVYEFMALEKCEQDNHRPRHIKKILEQVGLKNKQKQKLGSLSGGQFQRVMIARALLHEKDILIFDEPSSGIDIVGEQTIYDLIKDINQTRKTTCLIVSHELNIVNKYADNVLCLNKKMLCYGKPETTISPQTLTELFGINAGLYHSHNHK